jgi:acyl dehydratase
MDTVLQDRIALTIRLDANPRYRGSVHDDEVARRMGYRAALVPGAFLYGHFSRIAVDRWGLPWIAQGALGATFRRPVYNGDAVTVVCSPGEGGAIALSMIGVDGQVAAEGWIAPPATPEAPRLSDWPVLPQPGERPEIRLGDSLAGRRGTSPAATVTEAEIAESRSAFDERHPIYIEEGIAHPGFLMRRSMFEVYGSFRWPGPVMLTACEGRHFATLRPGQRLETSSVIAETFERRGKHYVVTDELVLADGSPAARFRRTQIYAREES